MDSAWVNREIRKVVRPLLTSSGFTAFTPRTAWRYWPGRIDILNFQSFNAYLAASIGCTTYSFTINLSVYLTGMGNAGDPERPEEFLGHLRFRPERSVDQPELLRRDIWYVDPEGTWLDAMVTDAHDVIARSGVPWFDRWREDPAVLEVLKAPMPELADGTQLPGNIDSPVRNATTGYLARRRGEDALALRFLSRALEQYEELDRTNAALKLRKPMPLATPPGLRRLVEDLSRAT
jgi:hypothetical protein